MLGNKQSDGNKESYRSPEWFELSIALAQQFFLLPDEDSNIEAIEQLLLTYHFQSVGQEEPIVRILRELSKEQFNILINPNSRETAKILLQLIESDMTKNWRNLLKAADYLLEKVAQRTSFSAEGIGSPLL